MISYIPKKGDVVWISMNPQAEHEQAGRIPAFTLSPESYNAKIDLAIICLITNQIKGYPFEFPIPEGYAVTGAILSDQLKSVDLKARKASFYCKLPEHL